MSRGDRYMLVTYAEPNKSAVKVRKIVKISLCSVVGCSEFLTVGHFRQVAALRCFLLAGQLRTRTAATRSPRYEDSPPLCSFVLARLLPV